MSARIEKKEVVSRLAQRLATDEKTAEMYLEATLDVFYEAFKAGESVTLTGVFSQARRWSLGFDRVERPEASLSLESPGFEIPLGQIYRKVDWFTA